MSDVKAPESDQEKGSLPLADDNVDTTLGVVTEIVNASGHRDQLDRQYGILSICGMALTVDNAWVAIGTSLNVAICKFCGAWRSQLGADSLVDNGGPPGVLYELLIACFYYGFIAASIAEVLSLIMSKRRRKNTNKIFCSWFRLFPPVEASTTGHP